MEDNKKEKIGFFEEETGVRSHTRLMSTAVFTLLVIINYWLLNCSYYSQHSYDFNFICFVLGIDLIFLIAVFYPKYLKQVLELGVSKIQQVREGFSNTLPIKDAMDINKEKS